MTGVGGPVSTFLDVSSCLTETRQTHKRTHNNERPFPCPVCGKRFKQKGNVKPHIENVHEKKQRWVCKFYDDGGPICGKDFSTIGNMKVRPALLSLSDPTLGYSP